MTQPTKSTAHTYRWPLVTMVVAGLGFILCQSFLHSARDVALAPTKALATSVEGVVDIAKSFQSAEITETFTAAVPELAKGSQTLLELATFEGTETLKRENTKRILWDQISLGTTVTEIRVKVTYRYHLRLADTWRLETQGQTCIVHAPRIRPSLPVAIHTRTLEKNTDEGWLRFNADEQMGALERSITPTLNRYAGDSRHTGFVREKCRQAIQEFVRNWLLQEDHWQNTRFSSIKVYFPDESEVLEPAVEDRL